MHARPRAFPFVSLNFRTVSDRLRRKKRKKEKGRVTREPAHPSFFPLPSADDVCRSTTLENRRLFFARSFPWIHRLRGCLPRPLSPHRARKFRNLFGAFFFFLCTTPEMTLVQFRIKYLTAKFLIQIFNSFTSQQLGEILDSSNK